MRIVYQIEGERETIRNINMFDMEKKKGAMTIVRKHTNAVRKAAKQRVPVSPSNRKKSAGSPGDLKKSIRAKYYYQGLGSMVMPAKPKGSHRHLVEYGTKNRYQRKTGRFVGRNKPQPFMTPAKRSQEASYNAAMRQLFEGDETIV
ncbi:tail component [Geobacillus phage GR1]|nr:tail component [Geobacillus phage GR1]